MQLRVESQDSIRAPRRVISGDKQVEPDRHRPTLPFPQGRRLPVGMSAHAPVPEYIRLIAAGKYSTPATVNWQSTSSPACWGVPATAPASRPAGAGGRRGWPVQGAGRDLPPQARCGDYKGRRARPDAPRRRQQRQAHRLRGARPASLTVARDLAPLGYDVTVFDGEKKAAASSAPRSPKFRLPEEVIDEETRATSWTSA